MDRRDFLRTSKYSMALPFLASFNGNGQRAFAAQRQGKSKPVKRLVCIGYQLGLYKKAFFANTDDPFILKPLDEAGLSKDFTTFSGLDHKGRMGGGHQLVYTFLTGQETPSVSLDQILAAKFGQETRYESVQLCAGKFLANPALSFTQTGMRIPAIISPSVFYGKIFGKGSSSLKEQLYVTQSNKSLLDKFTRNAKSLKKDLNHTDQHKLEEYFASVRGAEKKLSRQQQWLDKPFPKKDSKFDKPRFEDLSPSMMLENQDLMCDLIVLAIKNDTSRFFTLTAPTTSTALYLGNDKPLGKSYHNLTHNRTHRESSELVHIEKRHMGCVARIMKALKENTETDGSKMIDNTIVLAGSAMGDPAKHSRRNFPILVGGGGFKHKRHISCGTSEIKNTRLCDLYVTLLRKFGVNAKNFGNSHGDLDGVFA